jgi:imidazolonepropionase-like amidohydrolase
MGQRNVKAVSDAGVTVVFGTDSGALPTRIPGFAEHRELQLLVRSGLSPMEAIVCATRNSAEALGATDRGTLAPGQRADFLVLNGNPLEDIRHTTEILMIYHDGKRVR